MEFWEKSSKHPFTKGSLFIGRTAKGLMLGGNQLGVTTERHAITIAGAGAGKGACVIIPNLKRWESNALVIDTKGEAAAETYQDRLDKGQSVHVVDPFSVANVPEHLRAGFNPLDPLDVDGRTIGLEARVIADGLVKRTDPKHALWDDAAVSIIAGLIVFVKMAEEPEDQTLVRMREILRTDQVRDAFEIMKESPECGGIMQAAAAVMDDDQGSAFLSGARRHTQWLDFPDFAECLSTSAFSLSDLKHGNTTIYLVLPAEMMGESGGFLRMFVRCAIQAMQKQRDGQIRDKQCLFLLDEFYQLGKVEEIQKSMGLMRGYGLQIWPILQDLGQLIELYGREGMATFFGNSDLHQFFGNTDQETLEHVSKVLGTVTLEEVDKPPDEPDAMGAMQTGQTGLNIGGHVSSLGGLSKNTGTRVGFGILGSLLSMGGGAASAAAQASNMQKQADHQQRQVKYQRKVAQYHHQARRVGSPRYYPDQVAELVQKTGDGVAIGMINIIYGSRALLSIPAPFFKEATVEAPESSNSTVRAVEKTMTAVDYILSLPLLFLKFATLTYVCFILVALIWSNIIEMPGFTGDGYLMFAISIGLAIYIYNNWREILAKSKKLIELSKAQEPTIDEYGRPIPEKPNRLIRAIVVIPSTIIFLIIVGLFFDESNQEIGMVVFILTIGISICWWFMYEEVAEFVREKLDKK